MCLIEVKPLQKSAFFQPCLPSYLRISQGRRRHSEPLGSEAFPRRPSTALDSSASRHSKSHSLFPPKVHVKERKKSANLPLLDITEECGSVPPKASNNRRRHSCSSVTRILEPWMTLERSRLLKLYQVANIFRLVLRFRFLPAIRSPHQTLIADFLG